MKSLRQISLHALFPGINLPTLRYAKVWGGLALIALTLTIGGYHVGNRYGLLVGFLLTITLTVFITLYDEWHLRTLFSVTELEGQDPWGVLRKCRELTSRLRIPRQRQPSIFLIESKTPIAYSAGILPNRSSLFISRGLIETLTPEETEAILSYELIRLKNKLAATGTAGAALAGLITAFARALDTLFFLRLFWKLLRPKRPAPTGPIEILFSPLVALVIRLANSRGAILETDRLTAQFLGKDNALPTALLKLDSYNKCRPFRIDLADAHVFTVNPLARKRRWNALVVQPKTEDRIRRLTGQFPL